MRGIRSLAVAVLVLTLGCGGKAAPPPEAPSARAEVPAEPAPPIALEIDALPAIPSTPQPAPASLMGMATLGEPLAWIADVAAYADAVRPGVGAFVNPTMLVEQLAATGVDLRGVDLSRPLRVLALDPMEHPAPFVVVGGVSDESTLRAAAAELSFEVVVHDGWAAVGTADALRAAAPYALTTAVAAAVPRELAISLEMAAVVDRFRPVAKAWIDAIVSQSSKPSMRDMFQIYLIALSQLERVELRVTADRDRVTVATTVAPRADGSVARFIAAQRPGVFTLVEHLGESTLIIGGRLDTTALFETFMEPWLKDAAVSQGAEVTVTGKALFSQWATLMTGEHAMGGFKTAAGIAAGAIWDSSAKSKALKLLLDYTVALASSAAKPAKLVDGTYRGVRHTRIEVLEPALVSPAGSSGMPSELFIAAPGATLAFAVGADALPAMRAIIDAVIPPKGRKPTAVAPGLAAVLTAARARGDSYVMAVDLPAMKVIDDPAAPKPPVSREYAAATFGFGTGAIVLHTTLPAAQLAAVMP